MSLRGCRNVAVLPGVQERGGLAGGAGTWRSCRGCRNVAVMRGCRNVAVLPVWHRLPVHPLWLAALLRRAGPVAGDVKLQDDGVMHHPVDGRGGGHGVGEDALPL